MRQFRKHFSFAILLPLVFSCRKEVSKSQLQATTAVSSDNSRTAGSATGTRFGIMVADNQKPDQKVSIAQKFEVGYVRTQVFIKNYSKGLAGTFKNYVTGGFKVLVNFNWTESPSAFQTDTVSYKTRLSAALNDIQPEIAVIENEPTTARFHTGTIDDYIKELKAAVNECHQHGVKVADGAIHVPYIVQVMNGKASKGTAAEVKKLIEAYTTIPLDYINVHTAVSGTSYSSATLEKVANYLRTTTGKPVISNEINFHTSSLSLVKDVVSAFRSAGFEYAIVRSGDGNGSGVPLHSGQNLLDMGVEYRDDVK